MIGFQETLTTSAFNTLIVITFRNNSLECIANFVCSDRDVAEAHTARLKKMQHIEVLAVTNAVYQSFQP